MKTVSNSTKRSAACLVIACLVMGMATAAFAVPPNQVSRQNTPLSFTGMCCGNVGQTVTIKEPAKLVPVVVTWSVDFQNTIGSMVFGLSVNHGQCIAFGSRNLTELFGDVNFTTSRAFEWVILPSDGHLVPGMNSFDACGGSLDRVTDSYVLGVRTLAVRISK
jgi:hypothetical protein